MSSVPETTVKAPEVPTTEATPAAPEAEKKLFYDNEGNVISKAAWKKLRDREEQEKRKAAKEAERAAKEAEQAAADAAKRAQVLEEAKSIVLVNDASLGVPKKATVETVASFDGERVEIRGWVHKCRVQGGIIFIDLRDGTGYPNTVQCILEGKVAKTYDALTLNREATVHIFGKVQPAKLNKKGGVEIIVDYWSIIQGSSSDIENIYNDKTGPEQLLDQRHIVLRDTKNIYIMRARSTILQCFREHFWAKGFYEVTPPTIVQTQVEGGSTLFKFPYFDSVAYLTQSSQLYLETAVPVLGKVFCCMPSFRAEKSRTRRHLSEYTHFEGELGFITFDELLDTLEDMIVNVAERLMDKCGDMIKEINPSFQVPKRPFRRMNYSDAIDWLRANNVYKNEETKEHYVFGDDIPEAPERKMTDTLNEPIFLCRFPTSMKPFYMYRDPANPELTESVDVLMPGVGEIVGGSMRSWDFEQLLAGFRHEGIDPSTYYWYNDLRKYGSCPHGGWGLGIERYICWILGLHHIRDACLYPRFTGRAQP